MLIYKRVKENQKLKKGKNYDYPSDKQGFSFVIQNDIFFLPNTKSMVKK